MHSHAKVRTIHDCLRPFMIALDLAAALAARGAAARARAAAATAAAARETAAAGWATAAAARARAAAGWETAAARETARSFRPRPPCAPATRRATWASTRSASP